MHRLTIIVLIASVTAFGQQDDVLLTATHDKLNEVVRKALATDPETLKKWSKHAGKNEETKKEFCPHYEKRYLAGFYTALAESKQATGDKGREASSRAAWMVYLLASFRAANKEDLRQLMLRAREAAPESVSKEDEEQGFATRERIERSLAQLDQPPPAGRVRISREVAECFIASKVQPRYPMLAMSQRIQGDAIMKIVVATDGRVAQIGPISGPPVLLNETMPTVQKWQYRPYYLLGQPVEFESEVKVSFTISGG
jgi:hypothetical protein